MRPDSTDPDDAGWELCPWLDTDELPPMPDEASWPTVREVVDIWEEGVEDITSWEDPLSFSSGSAAPLQDGSSKTRQIAKKAAINLLISIPLFSK